MQGLDEILAITVKRMNMSVFSVRDRGANSLVEGNAVQIHCPHGLSNEIL